MRAEPLRQVSAWELLSVREMVPTRTLRGLSLDWKAGVKHEHALQYASVFGPLHAKQIAGDWRSNGPFTARSAYAVMVVATALAEAATYGCGQETCGCQQRNFRDQRYHQDLSRESAVQPLEPFVSGGGLKLVRSDPR
ncbi:hypothetical protein [Microtetraspora niveoalba]|uniref:hypothetical protein n=1 Tax=Microtetraspora niveoalba TaxID=46175 RepID=UPI00082EE454|nr:hypothetical protein [Microtetraspora niveoalba]